MLEGIFTTESAENTECREVRGWVRIRIRIRKPIPSGSALSALSVVNFRFRRQLFDRDALREVARLVHVGTARHGHVVGQKLQRQHGDQRLK